MTSAKFVSVFIAMIFLTAGAKATTLAAEKTTEKFEDSFVLKSSTLKISDKEQNVMKLVSKGLRKKALFGLVPLRVYVLQFLATQPEKLVKTQDGILTSLKGAGPIQLHLTFLRDLPGSKIADAFKDGLEANKVNVKKLNSELDQVLKEITAISEFKKGESFSVTVTWTAPASATIYLEDPKGVIKSVTGPHEFAEQFLSIWFGKGSDSLLNDLKSELIK